MFSAGDLKYTADEYRRKAQEQNEIAFNNALKTNIDYLEKTAKECRRKGCLLVCPIISRTSVGEKILRFPKRLWKKGYGMAYMTILLL